MSKLTKRQRQMLRDAYEYMKANGGKPGHWASSMSPCPRIGDLRATSLLRTGFIEESPYCDAPHAPDCIYNVYRGVPYVAVPTQPGKSYHGYPWRGRMSATIRMKLRERAEAEGHGREFDQWLKLYAQ